MTKLDDARIGVIGLGYVGLPLAVEFAKKYPVIGLDINSSRVAELRSGQDSSLEVSSEELAAADQRPGQRRQRLRRERTGLDLRGQPARRALLHRVRIRCDESRSGSGQRL